MLHRILATVIVSLLSGCANDMIAPSVSPQITRDCNGKMNDVPVLPKCSHCGALMEGAHALRGGENNKPHITVNLQPLVIVIDRDKITPVATAATVSAFNSEDQHRDGLGQRPTPEITQTLASTGTETTATVTTGRLSTCGDQPGDSLGDLVVPPEIPQASSSTGSDATLLSTTVPVSSAENQHRDGLGEKALEEAAQTSGPVGDRSEGESSASSAIFPQHNESESTRGDHGTSSYIVDEFTIPNDLEGVSTGGAGNVGKMESLERIPQKDDSASDPVRERMNSDELRSDVTSDEVPANIPADIPAEVPSDAPPDVTSNTPSDVPSDATSDVPSNTPSDIPSDSTSDVPSNPIDAVVLPPQKRAVVSLAKRIKPENMLTPEKAVERVSQMAAGLLVTGLPNYMKMIRVPEKTIHGDAALIQDLPLKKEGVLSMCRQFRAFTRPLNPHGIRPPLCKVTLVVEMSNIWHLVNDEEVRGALVERMDVALAALPPSSPSSCCIGDDLFAKAMLVASLSDVEKSELYQLFATMSFLRLIISDGSISEQEKAFIDLMTAVSDSPNEETHSHIQTASTLLQSLQSMLNENLRLTPRTPDDGDYDD